MIKAGSLFIDGVDAMVAYRVAVAEGGYAGLVTWPAFKDIECTEWLEEDGAEYDLDSPVLDARTFTLSLVSADVLYIPDFYAAVLGDGAYHEWRFVELGITRTLRVVKCAALGTLFRTGTINLTMADDTPEVLSVDDWPPLEAGSSPVPAQGWFLDGIDLSRYGVWVLEDAPDALRAAFALRDNLTVESDYFAGVVYDGEIAVREAQTVALPLLIHAGNVRDWRARWASLYAAVTAAGERVLTVPEPVFGHEVGLTCHYSKMSVSAFRLMRGTRHVWCKFTLSLVVSALEEEEDDGDEG